jgi:hypothetical protein
MPKVATHLPNLRAIALSLYAVPKASRNLFNARVLLVSANLAANPHLASEARGAEAAQPMSLSMSHPSLPNVAVARRHTIALPTQGNV